MRRVALLALLLLAPSAFAESRSAETCSDSRVHQDGYCAAAVSTPSCVSTGATTGTCSATSDETDGTRYICATSTATPLTGAQIESCTGGTAVAGSSAAETGGNTVALTGLTTDAAHYGQITNKSPEAWYSNVLVSASFTPVAPGTAPYDLTLSSTRTLPSYVSTPLAADEIWPNEPVTTLTDTWNSDSDIPGDLATLNGYTITVNAATYSTALDMDSDVQDIDFVVADAAEFTSQFDWGDTNGANAPTRIRWTGGVAAGWNYLGGTDILIDNVNVQGLGTLMRPQEDLTRIAVINSTFYGEGNGGADGGFIFLGHIDRAEWFILAGCRLQLEDTDTTHGPYRMQNISGEGSAGGNQPNGHIVVDNYFEVGDSDQSYLRLLYGQNDVWVADNAMVGVGAGTAADPIVRTDGGLDSSTDVTIERNKAWTTANTNSAWIHGSSTAADENYNFLNNTQFDSDEPDGDTTFTGNNANVDGTSTFSGNTLVNGGASNGSWEAAPSASGYGADH